LDDFGLLQYYLATFMIRRWRGTDLEHASDFTHQRSNRSKRLRFQQFKTVSFETFQPEKAHTQSDKKIPHQQMDIL
jgi:hypothetical protein